MVAGGVVPNVALKKLTGKRLRGDRGEWHRWWRKEARWRRKLETGR